MNLYEAFVVVNPDESDEGLDAVIGTLRGHIEDSGGAVLHADKWGRRKLAYPIRRKDEGIYVLLHADGPPSMPVGFRQRVRVMESILREMVILVGDEQAAEIRERAAKRGEEEAEIAKTQKEAAERRAQAKLEAAARPTVATAAAEATAAEVESQADGEPMTDSESVAGGEDSEARADEQPAEQVTDATADQAENIVEPGDSLPQTTDDAVSTDSDDEDGAGTENPDAGKES